MDKEAIEKILKEGPVSARSAIEGWLLRVCQADEAKAQNLKDKPQDTHVDRSCRVAPYSPKTITPW